MANETSPQIPEDIKKQFDELKNKLGKIKTALLKEYNDLILGIALLPKQAEKEKTEQKEKKNGIDLLVLIDEAKSKEHPFALKDKMFGVIEKIIHPIDEAIIPTVILKLELIESCYDGKYEILQMISLGAIVYDPNDMLAALRISEVHKSMSLKKFDKYIVSYVAAGSLFRGEKSHDIDVYIVIDDTDVKKMSRFELKDKLRAIIIQMGFQAADITGIKKSFHIQVYILTDFWESVKDASPVIFTFLRDGVPLYDRGGFMPWKLLLKMGKVKPSPEAIDMNMDIGDRLLERKKQKLLSVVGEDLYYATLNTAQAALMLYGIPPTTPKETVAMMEEVFVKKEKILEKKYVDILEKIRKYYKDVEHNKIKEVS